MIDLEKCKKEFLKYTEKFDFEKEGIKRKQLHSLRVMEECKKVAKALKLNEEDQAKFNHSCEIMKENIEKEIKPVINE